MLEVHVVWVALPPIHHIGMPLAELLQHSVAHKLGHHTAVFQVVKRRWKCFCVQGGYVLKKNLPSTKGGSILFPGQAVLLYGQDVPILGGFFPFSRQVFSVFICFDASQP
jgi:hypothetical protein